MKTVANQQVRDAVVAETIVGGVRRALQSVHGMKAINGLSELTLLRYAKRAAMLDYAETELCRRVYGHF